MFFKNDAFRKPDKDLKLFSFLDERQLLNSFFQFECQDTTNSPNRINSFINYFEYLYAKEELSHSPAANNQIKFKLLTTIETSKDTRLKSDISKAASVVLDQYQSQYFYTELAARNYWQNIDVSIGEVPREMSVEEYIYKERFYTESPHPNEPARPLPVLDTLSQSLFANLSKLHYNSFDVDRMNVILYSYCETIKSMPFRSYLTPKQTFQIVQLIINSLGTPKRKQAFSMYLGSLSGDNLFRNISQDKQIGKSYSEFIISWYHDNWQKDWYIPKFMSSIMTEYPEMKTKMEKKWGIWIE